MSSLPATMKRHALALLVLVLFFPLLVLAGPLLYVLLSHVSREGFDLLFSGG